MEELLNYIEVLNKDIARLEALDINKKEDLEEANLIIKRAVAIFDKVKKDYPAVTVIFDVFNSIVGLDLEKTLREWKEKISQMLKKQNDKPQTSCCTRKEQDNSEEECCCCCEDNEDDNLIDEFEPLTSREVSRIISEFGPIKDFEHFNTYCGLIADYINEEMPWLLENDEETQAELEDQIWALYGFIEYTMER